MSTEEVKQMVDTNFPKGKNISIQDVHLLAQVIYSKAQDDVIEVIRRLDGKDVELGLKPAKVEGRRVGNTTRLADWYVQYIFKNKENRKTLLHQGAFMIYDYGMSNKTNTPENQHLIKIILDRLVREHGIKADYHHKTGTIEIRK